MTGKQLIEELSKLSSDDLNTSVKVQLLNYEDNTAVDIGAVEVYSVDVSIARRYPIYILLSNKTDKIQ